MQFQVPQFIDIEPKIVGPLTLKQFIYLGGGATVSFISYFLFGTFLWILLTGFLGIAGAALAFIKINGQPMPVLLKSALLFFWRPRFYLWRSEAPGAPAMPKIPKIPAGLGAPKPRILDLLFRLTTTTQKIAKREKGGLSLGALFHGAKEKFEVLQKSTGERAVARRVDYR